jgi:hypothetical protein
MTRHPQLLASLLTGSCLLVLPAARADATLDFIPATGDAFTFNLGTPTASYPDPGGASFFFGVPGSNGTLDLTFISSGYAQSLATQGYGFVDLEIYNNLTGATYLLDGPQIYFGDPSAPTFSPETLVLTADPSGVGGTVGGTLVIDGGAATPEPSSLTLLGTAAVSLAGVLRRRHKA